MPMLHQLEPKGSTATVITDKVPSIVEKRIRNMFMVYSVTDNVSIIKNRIIST